jgi:hypothetical protein
MSVLRSLSGGKRTFGQCVKNDAIGPKADIDPFQNACPNHYDALALGL